MLMNLEIASLSESQLAEYAAVPIRFSVTQRIMVRLSDDLTPQELGVCAVPMPFEKDYDAPPGLSPFSWASRFRLRDWRIIVARQAGVLVGGLALAPAADVGMDLGGRDDTAVLWDLRVAPHARGQQIGTTLFRAAERWARESTYSYLVAETQDINVAACRFYQAMGCTLIAYEPNAYPDFPEESRLLWRRQLAIDRLAG